MFERNVEKVNRSAVVEKAKKHAIRAIRDQYTETGKPKPHGYTPGSKVTGQAGEDLRELHKQQDYLFDTMLGIEAANWETTKELYALGRYNFLKSLKKVTALSGISAVIGAAALILAVRIQSRR